MRYVMLVVAFLLHFSGVMAQGPLGTWKTIDDDTQEAKSHLQLYESNGKIYGKVAKLLKSAPDKKCEKCPGERNMKPILGMVVVEGMALKGGYWQSGRILDPEKGKWYTCNFWLKDGDPNVLVVRGYIGPFFRTQYWYRVKE
ncbi:MAG: DUF2147 domain-containing protein [Lewinellaceae bacterium]|nr:DUF2147 domain-containing protein [Lewinellaceae bacterium]